MHTHIANTGVTGLGSKLGSGTDGVSPLVTLPSIVIPRRYSAAVWPPPPDLVRQ